VFTITVPMNAHAEVSHGLVTRHYG